MVQELITEWDTPNSKGGLSIMYVDDETDIFAVRTNLQTMWTSIASILGSAVDWNIRTDGRILDTATGALTGLWADATPQTGSGSGGSSVVANASQGLIRWKTTTIQNGRLVQGRTFVPGIEYQQLGGGELEPGGVIILRNAASTFAAETASISVWHRPQSGSGGSIAPVVSADAWSEFAVQRGRR